MLPGSGVEFLKAPATALSTCAGVQSLGKNVLTPPLPAFGFQAPAGGFIVGSKNSGSASYTPFG
ncbi:hypothetical protein SAMN05421748_11443 [Paractinoplanes atraurantiacus]|uniref:Uncharacterized protein n=1 Tax=Paractinoplanes atraurantiacus TaxID=1036182 RepID=A0A285IZX8_9ACTN|nr:hypothetical protein SAMN05421748_11443 [Actinoplanes atraurantiacus]